MSKSDQKKKKKQCTKNARTKYLLRIVLNVWQTNKISGERATRINELSGKI